MPPEPLRRTALRWPVPTVLDADAAQTRAPASTDPALTNTQKNNEKKKQKKKQKKQQSINQQALLPDQSIMHPIIAAAHSVTSKFDARTATHKNLASKSDMSDLAMDVCSRADLFVDDCQSFEELTTTAECLGLTFDADDLSASDETPSLGDSWGELLATSDSEYGDHPTSDLHSSDKKYFSRGAASPASRARPQCG